MSKWNLIVDVSLCENCHNCVIAERDEHTGNDFPGYAAPAPAVGEATIRIERRVQGAAPMVDTTYLPVMCMHCDDAPCRRAAPDAITKRADGIVLIDPVRARGRREIVRSCPYGAIVWNAEAEVPQTWIFDAHLLDQGWAEPRCVTVCPTAALAAVKTDDAAMARKAQAEGLAVLHPAMGTKPRVWYRGLNRWLTCFIGGSVSAEVGGVIDCAAGAEVVLFRGETRQASATTDAFGDFRFPGLAPDSGAYRVEITHPQGRIAAECQLGESVYLGELRLSPATAGAIT